MVRLVLERSGGINHSTSSKFSFAVITREKTEITPLALVIAGPLQ